MGGDRAPDLNRRTGATDLVVDYYDAFAPRYDDWGGGLHRKLAAKVVELAGASAGKRALDVGAGTGLVANALAAAGASVFGVDLSEGMLERARAVGSGAQFIGMAAEHLVFRAGGFDLVACCDALTFFADPFEALSEIHRVTRPAGRLVLAVARRSLGTQAEDDFFAVLEDFIERHPVRFPRRDAARSRFGEPEVIAALLDEFGFELDSSSTFLTGWRLRDGRAWIKHQEGAGPHVAAALSALGPRLLGDLAAELDAALGRLGDEGQLSHHAFTVAVGHRRG